MTHDDVINIGLLLLDQSHLKLSNFFLCLSFFISVSTLDFMVKVTSSLQRVGVGRDRGAHTLVSVLQHVLHLLHRHLQHLCVLHLGMKLWKQPAEPRQNRTLPPLTVCVGGGGNRTVLTSVSASRVRSSCKLSLMRARLFFSTRGFLVCRSTHITLHSLTHQAVWNTGIILVYLLFLKCVTDCHQRDKCDTAKCVQKEPAPSHQPLELPFCPLSESHIRTHLLPYPVRCCWAEPTGPCLSLRWLLPYCCCFFLPSRQRGGQLANGTGFRKGGEREEARKEKKNRQTRRRGEAPSVYCAIRVRRAAGAEWLLLVFIGAY